MDLQTLKKWNTDNVKSFYLAQIRRTFSFSPGQWIRGLKGQSACDPIKRISTYLTYVIDLMPSLQERRGFQAVRRIRKTEICIS